MQAKACGETGASMRTVVLSLGFSAVCVVAFGRFLFAPIFSAERPDGATGLLLAAGPFHHRYRRRGAQMT
jgi:MYXO-CTERM domain-containing protein